MTFILKSETKLMFTISHWRRRRRLCIHSEQENKVLKIVKTLINYFLFILTVIISSLFCESPANDGYYISIMLGYDVISTYKSNNSLSYAWVDIALG